MLIAFEGPDKTGKTTMANALSYIDSAVYSVTKQNYEFERAPFQEDVAEGIVQTFDRIDWLTHMVYRLALPEFEWHDPRVRTVFAMPDTHLVFKLHDTKSALKVEDELYQSGTVKTVNDMYEMVASFFMYLDQRAFQRLYKSVSIMRVGRNSSTGEFTQNITETSAYSYGIQPKWINVPIKEPYDLVSFLCNVERGIV